MAAARVSLQLCEPHFLNDPWPHVTCTTLCCPPGYICFFHSRGLCFTAPHPGESCYVCCMSGSYRLDLYTMLIDTLSEMEGNCLRGKHHTLPQVTSPAKESQTQALSPEATPYKPKSHTDAADGSQDVCPNVDLALLDSDVECQMLLEISCLCQRQIPQQ